jgi:hypothetical protein
MFSIVTITREFGSAGKAIGKLAVEKFNIPYYAGEQVRH